MNIPLAKRTLSVKPSPTLTVAAKANQMQAQGKKVINLAVGEPDFDTPEIIKQAAVAALDEGYTKYTAVDGSKELKQAIKNKFTVENQLSYDLNQIVVTVGAKQAIYNLCQALLNPEDEVIIPAPFWVSYPDIVLLAEAKPVIIQTEMAQSYKITPTQLTKAITNKTKLFILNSPSNPSGISYTLTELQALGEVLSNYPDVIILSDDIYEHISWSFDFVNILNACPCLSNRTVIVNGVSKAYAMTGWRIGYAAGPQNLIIQMTLIQSQSTSNPCSIAQKAATTALQSGTSTISHMVTHFKERHDYVLSRLEKIEGIKVLPANGTFYIFPDVNTIIKRKQFKDDIEFAETLLQQTGVALVPGSAFGSPGCIRLSFAADMDTLVEAMNCLEKFCRH